MDALATVVALLKPQAIGIKLIHGAGRWGVRYPAFGQPGFSLVLAGSCWLAAEGHPATVIGAGDFILFPAMPAFTMGSSPNVRPRAMKPAPDNGQVGELFHGDTEKEPEVSLLGGYFTLDPVNASMLLEFLPRMLRIRATDAASGGVAGAVELIRREAQESRPGRAFVLERLIEIMLVEALRTVPAGVAATGLLAGLRDSRLAIALHAMHTRTAHPWTLDTLAREAAMSRSSFAECFARVVGTPPMNYLLQWRIAVAKNLLARGRHSVAETALAVGYESASGFSTAFSRETGKAPKEFLGRSLSI